MRSDSMKTARLVSAIGITLVALSGVSSPAFGVQVTELTMAQAKKVPLTPEEATAAAGKPAPAAKGSKSVKCGQGTGAFTCYRSYQTVWNGVPGATDTGITVFPTEGPAKTWFKGTAKPPAGTKVLSSSGTRVVTLSTPAQGAQNVTVRVRLGSDILKGGCLSSGSSVPEIEACADRLIAAMKKKLAAQR